MLTVDLNHLHILFMLVLAFFTYRRYQNNTLAIESQAQEQQVSTDKKQADQHVEEGIVNLQQISSQNVPEVQESVPSLMVAESQDVQVLNDEVNVYPEVEVVQEDLVQQTVEIVGPVSFQRLDKYEDQDSTLVNRNSNVQLERLCEEQNDEQFSSSSSSDGSSSSSDGSSSQEVDNDESKREKRKQIKKDKRKLKRNIRRQNPVVETVAHEVIEIQ